MSTLFWISHFALWGLLLLQAFVILVLFRQVGVLHMRLGRTSARITSAGPELGDVVPAIALEDMDKANWRLEIDESLDSPVLLVSVAPYCPSCEALMPSLRSLGRHGRADVRVALVSGHPVEALRTMRQRYRLDRALFAHSEEFAQKYGASVTPYAFLVAKGGRLLSKGMVNHLEHLESLLYALEVGQPSLESWKAARHAALVSAGRTDRGEDEGHEPRSNVDGQSV